MIATWAPRRAAALLLVASLGAGCYSVRAVRPESVAGLADDGSRGSRALLGVDGTPVPVARTDSLVLRRGEVVHTVRARFVTVRGGTGEVVVREGTEPAKVIPLAELTAVEVRRPRLRAGDAAALATYVTLGVIVGGLVALCVAEGGVCSAGF